MRWDNLRARRQDEADAGGVAQPLPLGLPEARVRTFDTPGFRGITFYEIYAKSIINKVPSASRVPFE